MIFAYFDTSALIKRYVAASGLRIPFVTGDDRKREAAGPIGLDIVWVGG